MVIICRKYKCSISAALHLKFVEQALKRYTQSKLIALLLSRS